jgi:hypothetical protein
MYISTQSRWFAQILLQQQKIANKQRDDDNELQPSFSVPATPSNWCIIGDCVLVIITKGLRSGIIHQFGAWRQMISFFVLTTRFATPVFSHHPVQVGKNHCRMPVFLMIPSIKKVYM